MKNRVFYIPSLAAVSDHAAAFLQQRGQTVVTKPQEDVTHLVLPIHYSKREGLIPLLAPLPRDVVVFGGNLPELPKGVDLLKDPIYLAENAAITAEAALRLAAEKLPRRLQGCPVLVLGWGRIGKCLAQLLRANGARVTVAARKEMDRAILRGLGYDIADPGTLELGVMQYRIIYNTVPAPILDRTQMDACRKDCIAVDLASQPGMMGDQVIIARGLPGKMLPEAAGELMARTVLRLAAGRE